MRPVRRSFLPAFLALCALLLPGLAGGDPMRLGTLIGGQALIRADEGAMAWSPTVFPAEIAFPQDRQGAFRTLLLMRIGLLQATVGWGWEWSGGGWHEDGWTTSAMLGATARTAACLEAGRGCGANARQDQYRLVVGFEGEARLGYRWVSGPRWSSRTGDVAFAVGMALNAAALFDTVEEATLDQGLTGLYLGGGVGPWLNFEF